VKIKLNGSAWKLKNVRNILDLKKKLISVGQLDDDGYPKVLFWKFLKGATTIAYGKKSSIFYKTNEACHLIIITINENFNLWPEG